MSDKTPATDDITIEDMSLSRERGLQMTLRHPGFTVLTQEIVELFDEAGGVNYVELTVITEKHGPMVVLIQRREGETPATQNGRLKQELADVRAKLEQARGLLREWHSWGDDTIEDSDDPLVSVTLRTRAFLGER